MDNGKIIKTDGWNEINKQLKDNPLNKSISTVLTEPMLTSIYDSDGIGRKIVEKIVSDSIKSGFELSADDKEYKEIYKGISGLKNITDLHVFDRNYGGCVFVYIFDDGSTDLTQPLIPSRCKNIKKILVYDRYSCYPQNTNIETDPQSEFFMEPRFFDINTPFGNSFVVHRSRMHILKGVRTSDHSKARGDSYSYWGKSALQKVYQYLCRFLDGQNSASTNMDNFTFTLLKMKGLQNLLATKQEAIIRERLKIIKEGIMMGKIVLVDEDEDLDRRSGSLSGTQQVMTEFNMGLSAAADMPQTILYGTSPKGMNSTGESDLQIWASQISEYQTNSLNLTINDLNSKIQMCSDYNGINRSELPEINYPAYKTLTIQEEIEARHKQMQIDTGYTGSDILSEEQIFDLRMKDGYSFSMDLEQGNEDFEGVESEDE